ncbi:MAG: VTT domain-containing protein [Rubrivivax sp.]
MASAIKSGAPPPSNSRGQIVAVVLMVVAALGLTAAWRWTPLSEMVDVQMLATEARKVADTPLAPLWVLAAFMVGSLVAMPVTLLIVATSLAFSAGWAFVYALSGALAASALNFGIGRAVGGGFFARLGGQRWSRLNRRLGQSGVLAVFTLRILPLAPFVVINLAAGASQVRFRDFMLGSLLGMAPGILTITAFSGLVTRLLRDPSPTAVAALVAGATLVVAAGWGLRRWTQRRDAATPPCPSPD